VTGDVVLSSAVRAMLDWIARFHPRAVRTSGLERLTLDEHGAILAAVATGDGEAAAEAMRRHLARANALCRQAGSGDGALDWRRRRGDGPEGTGSPGRPCNGRLGFLIQARELVEPVPALARLGSRERSREPAGVAAPGGSGPEVVVSLPDPVEAVVRTDRALASWRGGGSIRPHQPGQPLVAQDAITPSRRAANASPGRSTRPS
jgi:hypothetical protein